MEPFKECPGCGNRYTLLQNACDCGHVFTDDDLVEVEPEEGILVTIAKAFLYAVTSIW
jgi:hypothetical protein